MEVTRTMSKINNTLDLSKLTIELNPDESNSLLEELNKINSNNSLINELKLRLEGQLAYKR